MKWIISENDDTEKCNEINENIAKGTPIFLFLFLENCGPCMQTKTAWDANQQILNNEYANDDLIVARINQVNFKSLKNIGTEPMGYPCLRSIQSGKIEEYEDSGIEPIDRSSESFQKWISHKHKQRNKSKQHGGKKTRRHTRKRKRIRSKRIRSKRIRSKKH